jgi:hypothetical protein
MRKMHFISLLTAVSLLSFATFNSISASADAIPDDSPFLNTTTSILPAVMPDAHSSGKNTFLTIADLPYTQSYWTQCRYDQQVYCYEPSTLITASGSESVIEWGKGSPIANCHNNSPDNTKFCSIEGADWMEMQLVGEFTQSEASNTYRWKVRTGKIAPDILMLGDTQKTIVSGNANSGWTIEIWAKPTLKAYYAGCTSAATCSEKTVASRATYSVAGYSRMLGINAAWPSVSSESLRNALRGTFISTNGMSQGWVFSSDTFFVTAVSPHFLPPDATGKSEVTPGFVKVFLPESYITLDRGYKDLSMVTTDRVKLTVSGENATAKVTKVDGGILVDTGVEHFSAPNPEMMVLKASDASVAVVTKPAVVLSKLRKGTSKTLSSIAKTTKSQKPKWTASGPCKIVGTKLVALKKSGTCKVTLRILNAKKKYVVKTTKSFEVS